MKHGMRPSSGQRVSNFIRYTVRPIRKDRIQANVPNRAHREPDRTGGPIAAEAAAGVFRVLPGQGAEPAAAWPCRTLSKLGKEFGADDVFCCLGTTLRKAGSRAAFERVDYHMVVDLARAAKTAGAQQFIVVSAVGASTRPPAFFSSCVKAPRPSTRR